MKGHQRITCIFVVGCNNIEIRTSEVVIGNTNASFGVGFTSCSKGGAFKHIHNWLSSLPKFDKTDIIIYDGNPGTLRILNELYLTTGKKIIIQKQSAENEKLCDDVYYSGEQGRWHPGNDDPNAWFAINEFKKIKM